MQRPKISVIIPVYNGEDKITKSINSILKQNFEDYEIICINDGSTDRTKEILEDYANKYKNIIVYSQHNQGPGQARNCGIKKASGKYILFLDADDYLTEEALTKLYDTAQTNNSDLVLFNATEHYNNGITKDRIYHIHYNGNDLENFSFDYNNNINLVMNGYHIVCTKLHKLSFIKEHNIKFSNGGQFEDILFHIKSMLYAKRISYNPQKFYQYMRIDEDSRQNTSISTDKSFVLFDIFDEVHNLLINEDLFTKLEVNYYKFVINESLNIYKNLKDKYSNQFFNLVKNKFIQLNLDKNMMYRLPLDQQVFYSSVIKSHKYDEIDSYMAKEKKIRKTKIAILNTKNKLFNIIKH